MGNATDDSRDAGEGRLKLVRSLSDDEDFSKLFCGTPEERDGWVRVSDLSDIGTGKLSTVLLEMATMRDYPPNDGRTLGSAFALVSSGAISPFLSMLADGGGVLEMEPEQTWWKLTPYGNVVAVAVSEVRTRPSPSLERASAVELEDARRALRRALDPVYIASHKLTRVPVRAQWALIESSIAGWLLGRWPGRSDLAEPIAEALFSDGDVLWRSRPLFWNFEAKGASHTVFTRRMCCYNFNKLHKQDSDDGYCSEMCPLVPPPQRMEYAVRAASE